MRDTERVEVGLLSFFTIKPWSSLFDGKKKWWLELLSADVCSLDCPSHSVGIVLFERDVTCAAQQ
eukprot:scaffold5280_cov90-Skeletonema_dohrnii-CCMP3373.AAC.2